MNFEWESQHEIILKSWAEIGACYSWMHDRAYREFKIKNMYYAIPVIILSTLTGTANFAQQSIPEKHREFAVMIIGSLNLLSGLITTLAQFFKVNELQEAHRTASIVFSKFSRNISVELRLPIKDRALTGSAYLEHCREEYNRLIEQSPIIPTTVLCRFNTKFKKTNFSKPNISKLMEVEIYHDQSYEAKKSEQIKININEKEKKEREEEHIKTIKNLENIKQQMSVRLPDIFRDQSTRLDVSSSDSSENGDISSSSDEENKIISSDKTNIEKVASTAADTALKEATEKVENLDNLV